MTTLADAAARYIACGWPIFPIIPRGKTPLTKHGLKDATTDPRLISDWWGQWPDANIGYPTGERIVFDVDGSDGEAALKELEGKHGKLPHTLQAKTGRGRHIYFAANGASVKNSASKLGPHLDVRGEGGYVILPPSIHENGSKYEWITHIKPGPLPPQLVALLAEPTRPQRESINPGHKICEGQRNQHLASLAGSMRRRGMSHTAIEKALLEENGVRCDPPLPESEVRQIAASVARYEPALASSPSPVSQAVKPAGFSLVSLGELLARPAVPVDWLWEGRLALGTVSAVVSKPKVGKSTFARNLCLSVARGEPFFGLPTKAGACIYLALEERAEDVTADFRAMGATGKEPILIHADANPAAGVYALIGLVKEQKPLLVVIDPLFRIIHVKDDKAYAEMYNALGPLIDVARNTGTHLLLTHHMGKGMAKADLVDSPLGSTAIGGAVSSLIVLKRTENYRTIGTVQRLGEWLSETVLEYDPESHRLSVGGTRFEADRQECEEAILEFLRSAGEARTQPEIEDGVESQTKLKRKALPELVKTGRVTREGTGKRGDPYKYSFSCSQYIAGTRKQETQKAPDTRENTERNLVPTSEQKSFLVPEIEMTHFEGKTGLTEVEI